MAIPIILIHRSNSNYLPYTIAQAKWTNPRSHLFLIGDESNRYELVEHKSIAAYMDSATQFAYVYRHLSTNPIEYELFCFQRWFILKDFMARQALEQCFYLDSDVMLYENITHDQQRLKDISIALTADVPSAVFVNAFTALEQFCHFVFNLYQNPNSLQRLEAAFKEQLHNSTATSISDMFAFAEYRQQYPHAVGNLLEITEDSTYDVGMTTSDGFEMTNGLKNICFKQQQPFGQQLDSGKTIRFKVLHFQGRAKHYIKDYFTGDRLPDRLGNEPIASFTPSTQSTNQRIDSPPESRVVHCYAVVQAQPSDPQAHYELGCALLEQGQTPDAIRSFQTAIQLLPTFLGAYINLGVAFIQQNQAEDAIRCYHAALELQPHAAIVYGNLGYAYAEIGQAQTSAYYTALCNALEMVALKPHWAEAHRNLGLAYRQLGKLEDAIASFQQAMTLQPNFLVAQADLYNALTHQVLQQQAIQLRAVNLIIFPDWQQPLETLYLDLERVLKAVLTHSQQAEIALFVYTDRRAEADSPDAEFDAEAVLNDVMLTLLMTLSVNVNESLEISLIHPLSTAQWEAFLSQIQARIHLNHEDPTPIPETARQRLVSLELDAQGNLHL